MDLRIVFMGTPDFSVPCLDGLIKDGHDIAAVVTQPDRPRGRSGKPVAPPVKELALKHNLQILQPQKLRDPAFYEFLSKISPEIIVTVAYGKILPPTVLRIPARGCVNVHASLLPRYRGAAPINHAIINGEKKTGITTIYMDEGMDTGDVILREETEIPEDMTAGELHDILSVMGLGVLRNTLSQIEKGIDGRVPQDHEKATYAPMLDRETGKLQWERPAEKVHNLVRGTNPYPGAYTSRKGKRMKIWKTSLAPGISSEGAPGTILASSPEGLLVNCGTGVVKVIELQMENCRRMEAKECWHNFHEGEVLG